eukprot:m51a1_g674 putative ef hand domain containing protein (159) ;mRNA; f:265831-266527
MSLLDPSAPDRVIDSIFKKYDADNSGTISPGELRSLLYDLGYHVPQEQLPAILADMNRDGAGKVDVNDFKAWWRAQDRFARLEGDRLERLAQCATYFKYFDKDMSGSVSAEEFRGMYADLKRYGMVKTTVEEAMRALDSDRNGRISLNEFVQWSERSQ